MPRRRLARPRSGCSGASIPCLFTWSRIFKSARRAAGRGGANSRSSTSCPALHKRPSWLLKMRASRHLRAKSGRSAAATRRAPLFRPGSVQRPRRTPARLATSPHQGPQSQTSTRPPLKAKPAHRRNLTTRVRVAQCRTTPNVQVVAQLPAKRGRWRTAARNGQCAASVLDDLQRRAGTGRPRSCRV
jgi:hypothetical protein